MEANTIVVSLCALAVLVLLAKLMIDAAALLPLLDSLGPGLAGILLITIGLCACAAPLFSWPQLCFLFPPTLILVSFVVLCLERWWRDRMDCRNCAAFLARPPLSDEQFLSQFEPSLREVAGTLRDIYASYQREETACRLTPDDCFANLGFRAGRLDEIDTGFFVQAIEEEFHQEFPDLWSVWLDTTDKGRSDWDRFRFRQLVLMVADGIWAGTAPSGKRLEPPPSPPPDG